MQNKIKIAQMGLGHWGQNLLRNFIRNPRAEVVALCDQNIDNLQPVCDVLPSARRYKSIDELLSDTNVDAVSIATPSGQHFEHTQAIIRSGKDVFVEKPMTLSLEDAVSLAQTAAHEDKLVMVGHTYLYNAIVERVKDYIRSGELGDVYYAYSQRLNLGKFRQDSDVIWTLAPHDISMFNYWFDSRPHQVSARTLSYVGEKQQHAEICFAQLDYPNEVSLHLHLSWVDPQKIRKSVIAGSQKMLVYDDVDQTQPIKIYDRSMELDEIISGRAAGYNVTKRAGDVFIPNVSTAEPLYLELDHFIDCMLGLAQCKTDVTQGLEVTTIMDALSRSALEDGEVTPVDYHDL
ncbi:Gfo/Idh/MocA family oxidoreductase [Magnetovibrio sp. PR-2]|uniref:Gfo/Idh/MocA family protein n=1 Tax=Magnetovibrio sp. PR-2 TaxID=3120356 RepID=UPI002FCDE6C5